MKLRLLISTINPNSILRVVGGVADASSPVAVVQSQDEREEIVKRVNMHDELVASLKLAVDLMRIPDHQQDDYWFMQEEKLKDVLKKIESEK